MAGRLPIPVAHIWFILPWPYYPVNCLNLGPACALPSAVPKRFCWCVCRHRHRHRHAIGMPKTEQESPP